MQGASFTIHSLRIEGFKAFGSPQEISLGGHVFVFGRNGLGKSSIVEAVRWCLFGLRDRPDAEVRNVFYTAGECVVGLEMDGPDGRWRLQRRLRPGTGRSRLTIQNPNGENVPPFKVFPHIARLGPHEGTHIIFASQQSTHRRPQADITDFDRVLYSYLQIDDVPDLLNRLDNEIKDQEEIEQQLAEEVDEAEDSFRSQLRDLRSRIEEILARPPWPGPTVPTDAETDARIRAFVADCGGRVKRVDGGAVTQDWLLTEARQAILELSAETENATRCRLEKARADYQALVTARDTVEDLRNQLTTAKAGVESCEDSLTDALGNKTKEQLREKRDELALQGNQSERHLALVQQAAGYLEKFSPVRCPVCDTGISPGKVLSLLKYDTGSNHHWLEVDHALKCVEMQLERIESAEVDLRKAKGAYKSVETSLAAARNRLEGLLQSANPVSADRTIGGLGDRVQQLERELKDSGSLIATKQDQLKRLNSEKRFQEFRSREEQLQLNLVSGLAPAREAHREFVEVLESLRTIREAIQESFNNTLNNTLPQINALMTAVYERLTQQTSFPMIKVQTGPSQERRKLHMRVTSHRTPGELFEPSEVLNGQALNALNLVPYFVFSQFQAKALLLDCLLIDDPSQSFDTSRVELLLRELATAGTHAQLIVASHEEDRFAPLIGKHFTPGSYRVLRVTSCDPKSGPKIEYAD